VTGQEGLALGADEISATFAEYEANQPRPITYHQASQRYGPGALAARERYDELSGRHHLVRAYATLCARGEYDPAKHGTGDTEPLTAAEHLELLALGEYLVRSYKPSFEVDNALQAGATWAQIAEALDADEATARVAYRAWADGQHDMLRWTEGRLGMSDAEYAEVKTRAGELDPGAAKAYAATHRTLCADAADDGRDAHWLAAGEKCTRQADGEPGPEVCVKMPGSAVIVTYASQRERDRSLRLAEARHAIAAEGVPCPPWAGLSDAERELAATEARNWLRAVGRAGLLTREAGQ
jgi:hypothetical protein